MLVTQNTEYHLRDDVCVALRDCLAGEWIKASKALRAKLVGAVSSLEEVKAHACSDPEPGKHLLFVSDEGDDIITSRVEKIDRPPKEAIQYYLMPDDTTEDSSIMITV